MTRSKKSAEKSPPEWEGLPLTDADRDWLKKVTKNGRVTLEKAVDKLSEADALRLLSLMEPPEPASPKLTGYERHKQQAAARQAKQSRDGREIGPLPQVKNKRRRKRCERDLLKFLQTYFPENFPLKFSKDHLRVIKAIQSAAFAGLQQAVVMPRGSGKTTICECAIIWAVFNGHSSFAMLLGANKDKGAALLHSVKSQIETNDRLAEDYPEICHPVRMLEGSPQKASRQLLDGKRTRINWSGDNISLPIIDGIPSSGAVIKACGLFEAVRGASHFHAGFKKKIRPTLILVDDPSTDDSARSEQENNAREQIISQGLGGCAGPGEELSIIMPCTVIEPDDVASRFLDRKRRPEFRGVRFQMLYGWPENMELWEQYDAIRRRCLEDASDDEDATDAAVIFADATAFYRAHHAEMHKGVRVAWPERHRRWMIDGLQEAMTIYFEDPARFFAEYQNDPLAALDADDDQIAAHAVLERMNGLNPLVLPNWAQHVVTHIDCHKRILYFTTLALSPGFRRAVVNYGTYPEQSRPYFTERTARPTLSQRHPGGTYKTALKAGILKLAKSLFATTYKRADGVRLRMGIVLVDARWETDIVFAAAQEAQQFGDLVPAMGRMIGPDEKLLSMCRPRKGEYIGQELTIPATTGQGVRHVQFDANYWKDVAAQGLTCDVHSEHATTLFGTVKNGKATVDHHFYADHLAAQFSKPVTGKRAMNVWQLRPGTTQDHFFDTYVGANVAGSVVGAQTFRTNPNEQKPTKRKVRYAE